MRLVVLVPTGADREAAGAVAWATEGGYDVVTVSLGDAAIPDLGPEDVVWCHAAHEAPAMHATLGTAVRAWVAGGGGVLLSSLATVLAPAVGAPDERPQLQVTAAWRHAEDPLWDESFRDWPDYPHIRGAQGWGEHPLFDGLQRGTFTWTAREGEAVARSVFVAPHWPRGDVLAVDRAYVRLDAATAVAWEYQAGAGRILCLGANVAFTAADRRLTAQRDRYLLNAIASLDRRRDTWRTRRTSWPRARAHEGAPELLIAPRDPSSAAVAAPALPFAGPLGATSLELGGAARPQAPFTIAGQRTLVVGDEGDGVRECWIHPLCVLSEGLRLTVHGAPLRCDTVRVTPGAVERRLVDAQGGTWREIVATSPDHAVIQCEIAPVVVAETAELVAECALRLRLQWPVPPDALQPLRVEWEGGAGGRDVLHLQAADGRAAVRVVVDGARAARCVADPVAPRLTAHGAPGGGLRLAVIASTDGTASITGEWRALADATLATTLRRRAQQDEARRLSTVRVATPSPAFDLAWEWAKARLASFTVHVPGVGTGLTAGHAASRPGWGDARPGYAWFFGRDACWCGDALLAAGMFREARLALEFLAATADVTGKIAHEITTSGVAHYDAADATPLWLRFVALYADWTGDLATVRSHWDQVRAALAHVLALDTDGDGLPENTGVGHGWVESGPLGGGAVTSYVAAIWIDALRRLGPLAARLDDRELAERVRVARDRAERGFASRLRDPASGRVYLQLSADGPPARDLTALAAVPILLGVDRHPSADEVVAALASADFAPGWGVRMISRGDARYRPRGYHFGAVWPLFTGWASLAAFARDRGDLGWQHLAAVADCAFARQRGAFDEVLDGDTGAAAGVCPDQAWSAAMAISPFIHGMLGMQPSAADRRCTLSPRWPSDWREARVEGLRVGASRFALAMTRCDEGGPPGHRYTLRLEGGPPLTVAFGTGDEAQRVTLTDASPVDVTYPERAGGDHGRR